MTSIVFVAAIGIGFHIRILHLICMQFITFNKFSIVLQTKWAQSIPFDGQYTEDVHVYMQSQNNICFTNANDFQHMKLFQ